MRLPPRSWSPRCASGMIQTVGGAYVLDLSIAHDRFGPSSHVQQNGCLSHPEDINAPLRIAAQRRQQDRCLSATIR